MQEINDKKQESGSPASSGDNRPGNNESQPENVVAAHEQAESDIEQDADLSIHSPNDDLDEGELARLGEDENGLV